MNCKKIQKNLPEYLTGELSGNLLESIENHLKNCRVCQKELAELKKTLTLLDQLPSVELEPGKEAKFLTEIHQKIERQARLKPVHSSARWLLPRLVPSLAVASILVLLVTMRFRSKDDRYIKMAGDIFTTPTLSLSSEFVVDYFKTNGTILNEELTQISSTGAQAIEDFFTSQLELQDLVEGLTADEQVEFVKKISKML